MAALESDLLTVNIKVHCPKWMREMPVDELDDVFVSASRKAADAFNSELDRAEAFWKARKAEEQAGQMDIYDYV